MTLKKTNHFPKKSPTQKRSMSMVEDILEGAARILGDSRGLLNTNAIAKKAGVSIGSLYQYFSGKEAILGTLIDKKLESNFAQLKEKLAQIEDPSLDRTIDLWVKTVFDFFLKERILFSKLFVLAPFLGKLDHLIEVRMRGVDLFFELLRKYPLNFTNEELRMKAHVCVHSVMGVIQISALEKTSSFDRNTLAQELAQMIKNSLRTP